MIYVVATITVKPGRRDEFLRVFNDNVPNVLAEDGCISYAPTVDVETGLGPQGACRDDVVVVIEAWEDLDALKAHLQAPHMNAYKERTADMTVGVDLVVTEPA